MIRRIFSTAILTGLNLFLALSAVNAQVNLLRNPNAEGGLEHWRAAKDSTIEDFNGSQVFVVRRGCSGGSSFIQDVHLNDSDTGKYALFIGRGSSERINNDGSITGMPYLYGYMMSSVNQKGGKIAAYLQGQRMRAEPSYQDEWVTMFGIFRVVKGTKAIRFFLSQAERRNDPQTGSAARFNNLGLYLFSSREDALRFVETYNAEILIR